MMNTKLIFSLPIILISSYVGTANAQTSNISDVRFHNITTDTTKITQLLIDVESKHLKNSGDNIADFAKSLIGIPYVAHTLEGSPEKLTVNFDEMDCTTFVDNVAALALTLSENRTSWQDFLYNLQRMRYRKGKVDGYASRHHYNSDWAVENIHNGIVTDATLTFPRYSYITRSINFISENADKYEALSDSLNLEKIKDVEMGYKGHRFPYIKNIDLNGKETKAAFMNGDIVGLVLNSKSLDVGHMGIIIMENDEPHLLHASSSEGKVTLSKLNLADFMKRNRKYMGVRVYRLKE